MPRTGSARDDARRRAMQAKAARDQARKLREDQIATVLADYYLAVGQAERLREQAKSKADAVLADGEKSAQAPDASAAQAVRTLRDLLGGVPEVAELCGLTQADVRSLLVTPKATDAGIGEPGRQQVAGPSRVARKPAADGVPLVDKGHPVRSPVAREPGAGDQGNSIAGRSDHDGQ